MLLTLLFTTLTAHAGPDLISDAHGHLHFGRSEPLGLGVGGGLGVLVHPAIGPELRLTGTYQPELGVFSDARLGARWFITRSPDTGAFSLAAHGGLGLASAGVTPLGSLSVAADMPSKRSASLRFGLEYLIESSGKSYARFTVGVALGPRTVEEPLPPPPEPVGLRVFVTNPVCEWTQVTDLSDVQHRLPEDRDPMVDAEGSLPVKLSEAVAAGPEWEPPEAPVQGSLVLVGQRGDRVKVGEREISVGEDGLAVLTLPKGRTQVEITGGGRQIAFPVSIADGYAVWLQPEGPAPVKVIFELGSSVLSAEALAVIQEFSSKIGDYHLRLEGSFSSEGDVDANKELAAERAQAVAQAFQDAGLPQKRVDVVTATDPDLALPPEEQRSCVIFPIPPESTP